MDIEIPVQEQQPQIRRVTRLEDIRRGAQPIPAIPPERKIKPLQKPRTYIRIFILGLLFFGILGFELAIIHRYDELNKQLYSISLKLKDKISVLQNRLQHTNKIRDKLTASRSGLIRDYFNLTSQNKILQFRMDKYRNISGRISSAKLEKIDLLAGSLRVAYAKVEAVKVQNEVLTKELMKRDEYIRGLTSKLINNIGEQELIVNENLQLKKEVEALKRQSEAKNVNQ